jgi:predicted DNA binding CopG/RHH family protein
MKLNLNLKENENEEFENFNKDLANAYKQLEQSNKKMNRSMSARPSISERIQVPVLKHIKKPFVEQSLNSPTFLSSTLPTQ